MAEDHNTTTDGRRVDWFQVGADHWQGNQARLLAICEAIEWHSLPHETGMMQGEAIKALIREHRLPRVSHVADSHELAPYGLVGIRAHYANADVDFFAVDEGSHISSLCAFVAEKAVQHG